MCLRYSFIHKNTINGWIVTFTEYLDHQNIAYFTNRIVGKVLKIFSFLLLL